MVFKYLNKFLGKAKLLNACKNDTEKNTERNILSSRSLLPYGSVHNEGLIYVGIKSWSDVEYKPCVLPVT